MLKIEGSVEYDAPADRQTRRFDALPGDSLSIHPLRLTHLRTDEKNAPSDTERANSRPLRFPLNQRCILFLLDDKF